MVVTICHSSKVGRCFLFLGLVLTHLNIIRNAAKYPPHWHIAMFVPEMLNSAIEGVICLRIFGGDFNFKPAASGGFLQIQVFLEFRQNVVLCKLGGY